MEEPSGGAMVAATLDVVGQILDEMGIKNESCESLLVERSHGESEGDVVLSSEDLFGRFIRRFSLRMGCMPYALQTVGSLTVREFCELYVGESYPEPPETSLESDMYSLDRSASDAREVYAMQSFPICFVLGCGRSGTTLFRSMLNVHEELWAPGELHLAQFDTMAERATGVAHPFLRHALVPEAASRFGEAPSLFADRLASWERECLPIPEVYKHLYQADPQSLIVDKTPSYSASPQDLAWITGHFENARFVHIIRNPHDVIRSFVRIQLYKGARSRTEPAVNPYHVAELAWFRNNSNIAATLATVAEQRRLVVRYEDLVADPGSTLSGVCDLLGVAYEPRMENPYANGSGQVALGAGDPRVNVLTEVERREPSEPFYPLGEKSEELARVYGY